MSSPEVDGPTEQDVRASLRGLRDDDEPALDDVVTLVAGAPTGAK